MSGLVLYPMPTDRVTWCHLRNGGIYADGLLFVPSSLWLSCEMEEKQNFFFFHTLPGVSRHAEKTGSLKVYIVAKKVTLSGDITNAE